MPEAIVVGLDGSQESLAAADWAAREAGRRGLALRLVHAGEGPAPDGDAELPELAVPRHWARQVLRQAEETLAQRHPGVQVLGEQVAGAPAVALPAAAEDAEMLVLGSRGLGGIAGVLVGSVALATVAHARRPVVLVRAAERAADEHLPAAGGRPSADTPYREVLLALDPGRSCEALIAFAFDAAARRRAPLHVVHVRRSPAGYGETPAAGPGADPEPEAAARRAMAAALRAWREKAPRQPVTETALIGRAAARLPEAAGRAGLVVLGRRTRPAALGPHIGPVVHAAIHHIRRPVVVVPHE